MTANEMSRHPERAPYPNAGIANAAHCLPRHCSLPKAFQTNAKRLFGFFNAPQLSKASFRRCVALKKPLTL